MNLIFPFFFVYVFGEIFNMGVQSVESPMAYMLAGIIIATAFDVSFRVSTSTITDMTSGFMKEVLVSPVSRLTVALGQFLSSGTIAVAQGIIIYIIGLFLGFKVTSPMTPVLTILGMAFVGLVFAGFGLLIATTTKNMQAFQAASMALTMPMSFLSGAYIPLSMLNNVLTHIAYFNPMTYAVILFRTIVLEKMNAPTAELLEMQLALEVGSFTITPMVAALILLVFGGVFLILSTIAFVKTDFSKFSRSMSDLEDYV
jgi:ABC-2 type transport system permease protein